VAEEMGFEPMVEIASYAKLANPCIQINISINIGKKNPLIFYERS